MSDVVEAVQIALQEDPGIQALVVAPYIGEDAGFVNGWIFQESIQVPLENTERCAIVVNYGGGWQAPLDGNTNRFPSVVIDIWADPTRAADFSVQFQDAEDKCQKIYDAVFKVLHLTNRSLPGGGSIYFGDLRIISSEALGEPDPIQKVTDGNGGRMMRARFGISY